MSRDSSPVESGTIPRIVQIVVRDGVVYGLAHYRRGRIPDVVKIERRGRRQKAPSYPPPTTAA